MKYKIELLNESHNKTHFNCGEDSLNQYIHTQATQDKKRNLAAIYVLVGLEDPTIIGFYTLSASAVSLIDLPEEISKKLPRYPSIPVALLGRLAIDQTFHKQGLGELLLINALKKSELLSKEIGYMAIVVDALNEKIISYYQKFGFIKFKNKNKLFLPMTAVKKINLN